MVTTTSLWLLTFLFAVHLASAADDEGDEGMTRVTAVTMDDAGDERNETSPAMSPEPFNGSTSKVTEVTWNVKGINYLISRAEKSSPRSMRYLYSSKSFVLNGYTAYMTFEAWNSGDGVWLELFFGLCKGTADDFLAWPFRTPFTLTLLHPTTSRMDISQTFSAFSTATFPNFKRPEEGCNELYGFHEMITASEAKNRSYIVDDAVSVRVQLKQ
ncbi:TNF receptor-associated factor 3-like [Ornithodoros turicata]|uniref:TNF receptor-associated factor 3-like n=1 Tax=Ornithodoros turicata TaxID=34597 RepID=UPI00313A0531